LVRRLCGLQNRSGRYGEVKILDPKEEELDRACRVNEGAEESSRLLAGKPEGRGR
jgi:hypothetical protein